METTSMNGKDVRCLATICFTAVLFTAGCVGPASPAALSGMSYLDNGTIRLGVDLDIGGAITYLAYTDGGVNVVNSYDWGRQIQMSFYSGPRPFEPNGKKPAELWKGLGWNPIQSGDVAENKSKVIAHTNDGETIHLQCIPMHWPLDNQPGECTFEVWLQLEGNTVQARCRLNNTRSDHTQYGPHGQELPAVYTNASYYRLMTYTGDKPFTGDALKQIVSTRKVEFPWESFEATENWAAHVDDKDWGLGIWYPGRYLTTGGFYKEPGPGGPKDKPTGYIAPLHTEILDHNIQYDFDYVLILGTLQKIRSHVRAHAGPPAPPRYVFATDRQHWHYNNATDTGWPIRGELHVRLDGPDPKLIGPAAFWHAADGPKLYIRAAYHTKQKTATVMWRTYTERGYDEKKSVTFPIQPDGEYHTYEIDLSASPQYTGPITGLRFDPTPTGEKGDFVKIQWISFRKES